VQRVRQALHPPGHARADWQIVADLARRTIEMIRLESGQTAAALPELDRRIAEQAASLLRDWSYAGPSEIWEELRRVTPEFYGITYERLDREGGVHWPCPALDHPGSPYLFADDFPRGKGLFLSTTYGTESELPDDDYPFTLNTGRVLYHWHGGTLTRASALTDIWPECTVELHPNDAARLGLATGDWVDVASRRGQITARLMVTGRSPERVVFIPFHFAEAAANTLTDQRLDKRAKIPDYKVCAVRVARAAVVPERRGAEVALTDRGTIKDPTGI
jgi:predicted molibdopterin-dependent oxidoreductase YjgC